MGTYLRGGWPQGKKAEEVAHDSDPAGYAATYPDRKRVPWGMHLNHGGVQNMSVLVTVKLKGDTEKFRQSLVDRADEYVRIADMARPAGALHHRFGIGDGYVMISDEWASVEDFQKFFSNPDLNAFIGSVGGDPAAPEIIVAEAVNSPDQF
jgi:hypothetical protein